MSDEQQPADPGNMPPSPEPTPTNQAPEGSAPRHPAEDAADRAAATTRLLMKALGEQGPEATLANASVYLDMLGHVTVAWIWLRKALAAQAALDAGDAVRADMLRGKIAAARFFFAQDLPMIHTQCDLLDKVDRTALDCEAAWF